MKLKDLHEVMSIGDYYPSIDKHGLIRKYSASEYPLSHINGDFVCVDIPIRSLVGSPIEVKNNCLIKLCQELTSLEGAPMIVHGNVEVLQCRQILSFQGIGKNYFKEIGFSISIPDTIISHILGILRIKNLKTLRTWNLNNSDLSKSCEIIHKHLDGDRDMLDCQEELIQAGFKEFAKL